MIRIHTFCKNCREPSIVEIDGLGTYETAQMRAKLAAESTAQPAAPEPDVLTGFAKEAADRFWRTRGQR